MQHKIKQIMAIIKHKLSIKIPTGAILSIFLCENYIVKLCLLLCVPTHYLGGKFLYISQTLQNNNISDRSDIEHLKAVQQETDKKIAVLKNSFENCKQMYDVYMDIAKTYYDISKGDYISKLVWEKQKMQTHRKTKQL